MLCCPYGSENPVILSQSLERGNERDVQSGVDHKHKLIVHHRVTNAGNDQNQLRGCLKTNLLILNR